MYSFANDYSEGAHPNIMQAMIRENRAQNTGYGMDVHCERAKERIRQELGRGDVDIHFLVGGTQTNLLAIAAALRPHQAAICANTGHINTHEAGSVEATGHKVIGCPSEDGKLTPAMIQAVLDEHTDEHMVQPKLVYISNSTEVGTQYTRAELEAIAGLCRQKDLYLFLDGARLGAALTSPVNDLTMADVARLTDMFYIGGTKNGALMGEALVIVRPQLKTDFRYLMKQRGAMLAKGWLLGIQFEVLFQNRLFYEVALHANRMADLLREGIARLGYSFQWDSRTNQVFPVLPDTVVESLSRDYDFLPFGKVDDSHTCIRLITSWATEKEPVETFLKRLAELSQTPAKKAPESADGAPEGVSEDP